MKSQRQSMLTDEYLLAYSAEHLWYEVWMLFDTGSALPGGVTSPLVQFVDNAILESFAIHLRNLLDFFYPDDIHTDDVIAADYFDSGIMPPNFPAKSKLLKEAKFRANKWVNHLTTKRLPGHHADKTWYVAPLLREVSNVLEAFIATASPHKLNRDFAARVSQMVRNATVEPDS